MNFSEAMFYENYLISDFLANAVFQDNCLLLVKMASKTVMRPIDRGLLPLRYTSFRDKIWLPAGWIPYLIPDKCSEDENQEYFAAFPRVIADDRPPF